MPKIKEAVAHFFYWVKMSGNGDCSHLDTQSFAKFDVFMDKTIQYLASSSSKSIGCQS
jgi:hypothetical protein